MTLFTLLLVMWGAVTLFLIVLFALRSAIAMKEEDMVLIGRAEAAMEKEQMAVARRIDRLDKPIKLLAIASGALLVLVFAWWFYQGLFGPAQT